MSSSLPSASNPPVAAIHVPPPSRLHQRTVSRQVHTAPRSMMHHKWTMSESYEESQNGAVGTTTPLRNHLRRNLFSSEKPASMDNNNRTPLRSSNEVTKTPQRNMHRAMPKRSNSGEYCGLTAEITRELQQRSAKKTPRTITNRCADGDVPEAGVTFVGVMSSGHGMQTPPRVMRKQQGFQDDIFRMPKKNDELTLVPTISASSSDDVSPKEVYHQLPPVQEQTEEHQGQAPPPSSKKKRGITTPIRIPKKKIFSSAKKIKKCLTPPREGFGSHLKSLSSRRKLDANEFGGLNQFELGDATSSPGSTLSTALPGVDDFKIHSTEYDPFDFQCEIPPKREVATHAKICNVVDSYTAIHLNFNFAMLAGLTRNTLEKEYERTSDDKPMIAGSCHRDVVKGLLECEDDLVVEGFFREYVGDNQRSDAAAGVAKATTAASSGKDDRVEVIIFSSEKLRQIIVCYRGSTASQAKPLKMNYFGKEGSSLLHQDQQVRTLSAFRDAYFGTPMEETVFALLANLATRKPFFDVVMTGHSFGAALATIGAMRYATAHPMMRVSCHVFGCPRIGGEDWRQLVHSVANLKVFRVENASDPYVLLPSGSEWVQVGHAISVVDTGSCAGELTSGVAATNTGNGSSSKNTVQFTARRFDRDRIVSNSGMFDLIKCPKGLNLPRNITGIQGITTQGKVDHEMKCYADKIINSGDRWFTDFTGMEGNGVISFADNERRLLS
ncbi:hypothetical protein HJC23_000967 [Cyclotella cryptica]|uniref:Fungal lipase-type domain-containing protein n=1 Tax=Cyclotella cryptica TaxID=29204 RepID=A0ABD3QMX2_9STRA|eukprot:CCRYP_004085-RA/>CCRYP_004085-RA protein AED:0.01 eAED:0.01 QI:347/1/1/1/1/1/2/559/724